MAHFWLTIPHRRLDNHPWCTAEWVLVMAFSKPSQPSAIGSNRNPPSQQRTAPPFQKSLGPVALALGAVARRSAPAAGDGGPVERNRPACAHLGQLVGRRTGNGGWSLLSQAAADLDGGQLGVALAGPEHQPAALVASGSPGPVGRHPADRGHPRDGQHRQRCQPLAGDRAGSAPTIGIGQALPGAARGRPVCPLETHRHRPETAVAGGVWGPDPADPQAAQPQHSRPFRLAALADGHGRRPLDAPAAGRGRSWGAARHWQHHAQRIPAHQGGVLPQSLE